MYKIKASDGRAKRASLETPHGVIETPVFMNVATAAAIKGALSAEDLRAVGCQVALCNTYHLHLRPGEEVVRRFGGLRPFMAWDGPVLTDSGGFQVFSLGALRKIKEEGVYFSSHIDGRKIFMGPEESMNIQSALGATIAMAFDECAPFPATREYMLDSVARTTRWLERCKARLAELNTSQLLDLSYNPLSVSERAIFSSGKEAQTPHIGENLQVCADEVRTEKAYARTPEWGYRTGLLFGINQGGIFLDIRAEHAKAITEMNLDGYAIGGLAVGEPTEDMYNVLDETVPRLPKNKPTYLMGVGTPENILESVERGVDFFDCVLPARNGRHGHLFTSRGRLNITNAAYERDERPIDPDCGCPCCRVHSRGYIRHLFKAKEMLAMRLCVLHNLYFYNRLMAEIRGAIEAGVFVEYKRNKLSLLANP